jgi:hypothetical protein
MLVMVAAFFAERMPCEAAAVAAKYAVSRNHSWAMGSAYSGRYLHYGINGHCSHLQVS